MCGVKVQSFVDENVTEWSLCSEERTHKVRHKRLVEVQHSLCRP